MTIDKKIPITADEHIREEIEIKQGQYINTPFLETLGYQFKCSMHRGYELWISKNRSVILEPTAQQHFMVYKTFKKR